MIPNQFRTLLVNLPAQAGSEFIPSFFTPITLPKELNDFYNLIFPVGSSRNYKEFLVHNYLMLIESTQYRDELYKRNPTIVYASIDDYFQVYRISAASVSNSLFPIFINGKYKNNINSGSYYNTFLISQIGSSNDVLIQSQVDNTINQVITLSFTNNISDSVDIVGTGLSFRISGANFGSTSNKTWEFLASAPYVFDVPALIQKLENNQTSVITMLNYKFEELDEKFSNLWRIGDNSVYRITGLLCAYVNKVERFSGIV